MYVIAVTGGIASGKSAVAGMLREAGVPVLSADAVARALTSPGGAAAAGVLALFGTLDRAAIAATVFADGAKRAALNALVHPLVRAALHAELGALPGSLCAAEIPLLFESGMEDIASEVWTVYVPIEEQLRRLAARDGLTRADALARVRSQMPAAEKIRRADFGVYGGATLADTRKRVTALLAAARARAAEAAGRPAHA